MARDNLGTGTTTLGVRLPVSLVGRLYLIAGERKRNVSVIVGDALEEWLKRTEIEGSSSPSGTAAPAPSADAARTPSKRTRHSAPSKHRSKGVSNV